MNTAHWHACYTKIGESSSWEMVAKDKGEAIERALGHSAGNLDIVIPLRFGCFLEYPKYSGKAYIIWECQEPTDECKDRLIAKHTHPTGGIK